MSWPLPTLPDAVREGQRQPMPGKSGKGTEPDKDPLTALWMLAQQSRPTPSPTAAQGQATSVRADVPQAETATYDQPSASPVSNDVNPFSSLALTLRHESFAQRFPWLGE